MKKIILGTANLNRNYGLLKNNINIENFRQCLKILKKNNQKFIESSTEYKNSLKTLSKFNLKNFNLIIKFNYKKNYNINFFNKLKTDLKIQKFYCLMLHNPDLIYKNKRKIQYFLDDLRKNKICKKIGISLYNFNSLKRLNDFYDFDIVQLPTNIFDQRILRIKNENIFKNKIIQARSIFLQGIILKKYHKFSNNKNFKKFNNWTERNKYYPLFECINYIKQIKKINHIVLGANSIEQLNQILNAFKKRKVLRNYKNFNLENEKIINPSKW